MTLDDFKDVYANETPAKKLVLLLHQIDYIRADAESMESAKWRHNDEERAYWEGELEAMYRRVAWLYSELMVALNHIPRLITEEDFENNANVDAGGFLPCWGECDEVEVEQAIKNGVIQPGETVDGWTEVRRDEIAKDGHMRFWTARPTKEQMETTPWPQR